ncbi:hypothetical protein N7532_009103 [Penicillium argentinense]|uniref:NADH-ubiquinone oxidoreductase 21 kDa subunit n=1 Tax=Penicillium argentinense TaxID=1131581 RepID=A0A9W9K277_9EURO|nr:uncharacterized protein N7532_009103 [Penicillium argentinense]KAJ5090419.1 hypothetical protein N7532_009103 [Penicillium argentinense]
MASDPKADLAVVPPKLTPTDYPVIDTDPHMRRVFGYARNSDYAVAGAMGAVSPFAFWLMERLSPSQAGRAILQYASGTPSRAIAMLTLVTDRFYGFTENKREVEMDMREMVDKVKKGEPLYGAPHMSSYLQGVAARNSRYSQLFIHVIPWGNFFNHDQHGVDTAKYYQQAERELEAERLAKAGSA